MSSRIVTALSNLRPANILNLLEVAGQLWLREFLALFPTPIAAWLVGGGSKTLSLICEQDIVQLQLRDDGGRIWASRSASHAEFSPALIDDFLRSQKLDPKDVALAVQLPAHSFFERSIILPIEAAELIDEIVAQDLQRKTPFQLDDIHCDHIVTKSLESNKLLVSQWVIQREFVRNAVDVLGVGLDAVTFVEADGEFANPGSRPTIALDRSRNGGKSPLRRPARALAISAILLILVDGGLKFFRQQSTLDDLAVQIAAVRPKAQEVRSALNALEQKRLVLLRIESRKQSTARLLDIWQETTRLLPSHSWLTELGLSQVAGGRGQRITMSGFSSAASSLVGLIDSSPLFADAALTSPIASDSSEGRERFSLQAKVFTVGPRREATR
jgi:general secretion pathway protein L